MGGSLKKNHWRKRPKDETDKPLKRKKKLITRFVVKFVQREKNKIKKKQLFKFVGASVGGKLL